MGETLHGTRPIYLYMSIHVYLLGCFTVDCVMAIVEP